MSKPLTKRRGAGKVRPSGAPAKLLRQHRHDPLAAEIGDRVRKARHDAGLDTLVALHKRTINSDTKRQGISKPVLAGYEDGNYRPGARELKLLSLALNITPNWLLFGTEKPLEKSQPLPAGSQVGLAVTMELAPEEERSAMLGGLFARMRKGEREAWLTVIEQSLRSAWGDKKFEAAIEANKQGLQAIFGAGGQGPQFFEILKRVIGPEKMAEFETALQHHFESLGLAASQQAGQTTK